MDKSGVSIVLFYIIIIKCYRLKAVNLHIQLFCDVAFELFNLSENWQYC